MDQAPKPQKGKQQETSTKSKSLVLKKILMVLGIVFVLIVAKVGYDYYSISKIEEETKPKANEFMQLLSEQEIQKAYDLTTAEFRQTASIDDFAKYGDLYNENFNGFDKIVEDLEFISVTHPNKPKIYVYKGIFTDLDGKEGGLTLTFTKKDGEYKIYYFKLSLQKES